MHWPRALYQQAKEEVNADQENTSRHAGARYQAINPGCVVDQADGLLLLRIGSNTFDAAPGKQTVFFSTDRDLDV